MSTPHDGRTFPLDSSSDYEALWERRLDVLRVAARHGAHHVRIPAWAADATATPTGDLEFLVDLDESRTLLDHAALQLEIRTLLGRRVNVINDRGLRPWVKERMLEEFVPF